MRRFGLAAIIIAACSAPIGAQVRFVTPDEEARMPYVACHAWFGMEGVLFATPDAANHPKASTRFKYHADKFAKAQGRAHVYTDCIPFTQMAPSLRQSYTVGYSFYNSIWKQQVQVQSFPGLPADWSTTPVPGEDGDKKSAPDDPGGLRTITYLYPKGTPSDPGYDSASIRVKYRIIACMGEVHVAYALDPKSVRASDYYHSKNGLAPVGDIAPPEPQTIEMIAVVKPNPMSEKFGLIRLQERYGKVADKYAAPALGYGCFTGQTQKVGLVKDIVPGKHDAKELDAILNDALILDHQFIGMRSLPRPLRNASLDNAKTVMQRVDEEQAAADKAELEARRKIVDAEVARAKAMADKYAAEAKAYETARATYEAGLAAKRAADEKYAQDMAIHQAEVARAAAERKAYEASMEEYRRETGRAAPKP